MNGRMIIFLLMFFFATAAGDCHCLSSDKSSSKDEIQLLNEIVAENLKKAGIDTNFSFSGNSNMTVCLVNQTIPGEKSSETFSYQGNIFLRYDNKNSDFGYGFEIGTKQKSGLMKQGNPICDSSFLYLDFDNIGRIKIGYTDSAAFGFCTKGDSVYVGYQGPGSGDLPAFYNLSAGAFIDSDFFANDGKALKIAWYSPVVNGISFAISFTPDSKSANLFRTRKNISSSTTDDGWDFAHTTAFSKNVITGGLAYECGTPDDFNMKVSLSGWMGKGVASRNFSGIGVNNVRAYNIGCKLGYRNFSMAAGFLDSGHSLMAKRLATEDDPNPFDPEATYNIQSPEIGLKSGADAGKIYSVGMAYKSGNLTLSGGYFWSTTKFSSRHDEKSTAEVLTIAVSYAVNKMVSIYAEYNDITTKTCERAMKYKKACGLTCNPNNRASMFMVGTNIKF
jgi:predicted porin